jgi:PAS domain S-box-containing protein
VAIRHWQETAGKLTEKTEELQAIAQRLRLATNSGRLGVWEWDVKSGVLVWDERMFELYGVSPTARTVTFATWENNLHPEDRERARAEVQSVIADGRQYDTEFRVILADGSERHLKASALVLRDSDNSAVRMIGINRDISERKQMEAELAQHREHLEELIKQRTDALNVTVKELHAEIAVRLKIEESLRKSEETLRQINVELDQRVWERTAEIENKNADLQKMNKIFVGRELRMIELKKQIKELEENSGKSGDQHD